MSNVPDYKKTWKPIESSKKPEPYELVLIALKRGVVIPAWWTGNHWDARRLKEDDEVLAYKSMSDQTNNAKRYP